MKLRPVLLLPILLLALVTEAVSPAFVEENNVRLEILFTHLDPGHPAMGPILSQWQDGDRTAAATALAAYFEQKDFTPGFLEPLSLPANLAEEAEAALGNRFRILEKWESVPSRPGGGIDWDYRGRRDDKETAWMLNRHGFLPVLAEMYRQTGDKRYREQLNALWSDWIIANPYPRGLSFTPQWRALEAARRVLNVWVRLFYDYDVLDPETRLLVLASVLDHGNSLRHHASFWGGNHLISEKLALLSLACAWPEFTDFPDWTRDAVDRLSAEFMKQTYPDGSYKELSNHYQRVVLVNARLFIGMLNRLDAAYRDPEVVERIERMWDFFAQVQRPDGYGPLNNASDREVNAWFLQEAWSDFDRPDWLYIATNGREGEAPLGSPSVRFPSAGQVILRSGWDRQADWIYFDAGPFGTAHQHVDRFHVSASLNGRQLLVDNGRYTYKPGPWKDYFQGPRGHNLLLLDGKPAVQAPRDVASPLPIVFTEHEAALFTAARGHFAESGLLDGFSPASSMVPWTRAILYDRRGFIIILDRVESFSIHQAQSAWHFHPDVTEAEARRALRLAHPKSGFHLMIARGSESHPLGGFYSPDYDRRIPSVRIEAMGTIIGPSTLVWVLQDPEEPPVEVALVSPPNAAEAVLSIRRSGDAPVHATVRLHPVPELVDYARESSNDGQH